MSGGTQVLAQRRARASCGCEICNSMLGGLAWRCLHEHGYRRVADVGEAIRCGALTQKTIPTFGAGSMAEVRRVCRGFGGRVSGVV